MGSALLSGAIASGILDSKKVIAFDVDKKKVTQLKKKVPIRTANSLQDACFNTNFIFLCVKPHQMNDLLLQIRNWIGTKQCLLSIAAGISTKTIESYFSSPVPVVRIMPNTPALVGAGIAAITKGRYAKPFHLEFAKRFFSSVGKAVVLPEKFFDAVTAVSGSGPAYLFYLTECLEKAAEKVGLKKSMACLLARQTISGAAKMLNGNSSPEQLRRAVTSPGGTTESAIKHLERKGWHQIFIAAVKKAQNRSKELGAHHQRIKI